MGNVLAHPIALDHEKLLVEADILPVDRVQVGTAHAQVVHRIKHIRFPGTVFPDNTIYTVNQMEFSLFVILEIDQGQRLDVHSAKVAISVMRSWQNNCNFDVRRFISPPLTINTRVMRILLICTVFAALASACRTIDNSTPSVASQNGQVISILHGTSYGHCIGYCVKEELYRELSIRTMQSSRDPENNPEKTSESPLSDGEFAELVSLIDWNKWNQLEVVIGCPDCADGGAEYLEITTPEGKRRVTFDAGSNPDGLEKLLDYMRKKRTELYGEER
jgi:hypothetical protein